MYRIQHCQNYLQKCISQNVYVKMYLQKCISQNQGVKRGSAGEYRCIASNIEGDTESNILDLQIYCKLMMMMTMTIMMIMMMMMMMVMMVMVNIELL